MQGWIKLHRKVLRSSMYKQLNSKQRDVMWTVLLLANHESNQWEFRGEIYSVKPGQFITSLDHLQENCASDVSIQSVRTALLKLEKHEFLTNESTMRNRLITVVNWGFYQGIEDEPTKSLTGSQQSPNKELTTNKNVKNDKNEKKLLRFEEFWNLYPKKAAQKDAEKAWTALNPTSIDEVITAAKHYAEDCKRSKRDKQYIKLPATFLRQERWKDYLPEEAGTSDVSLEQIAFDEWVRGGNDPSEFTFIP
ncbi:hypothetical protein [Paenibacillus sp. RC84]|uniref:hypothetical protein n=1 Tax=Paenibacillus sp. RC84 TaxID=3156252 RepID=UPI0035158985